MGNQQKTGGRTAGTPNKRTQEVINKLDELGCDPIQGMATIAMDEDNSKELRAAMYKELAQYIAPKRRAIEQTIIDIDNRPPESLTDAELTAIIRDAQDEKKGRPSH